MKPKFAKNVSKLHQNISSTKPTSMKNGFATKLLSRELVPPSKGVLGADTSEKFSKKLATYKF